MEGHSQTPTNLSKQLKGLPNDYTWILYWAKNTYKYYNTDSLITSLQESDYEWPTMAPYSLYGIPNNLSKPIKTEDPIKVATELEVEITTAMKALEQLKEKQ